MMEDWIRDGGTQAKVRQDVIDEVRELIDSGLRGARLTNEMMYRAGEGKQAMAEERARLGIVDPKPGSSRHSTEAPETDSARIWDRIAASLNEAGDTSYSVHPVRLGDTQAPASDELFSNLAINKGNIFADYDHLQRKHPDQFATAEEVKAHVESVLEEPHFFLAGSQPDHRLIVRRGTDDHAVIIETEYKGGKYRVRSAYRLTPNQLELKIAKERLRKGANLPVLASADNANASSVIDSRQLAASRDAGQQTPNAIIGDSAAKGKDARYSLEDQEVNVGYHVWVIDRDGNVRSAKIMDDPKDGRVHVESADRQGNVTYSDDVPEHLIFKYREDADAAAAKGDWRPPNTFPDDPFVEAAEWLAANHNAAKLSERQAAAVLRKQFGDDVAKSSAAVLRHAQYLYQNRIVAPNPDIPWRYQTSPRGKTDPIRRVGNIVRQLFVNQAEPANRARRDPESAMGLKHGELLETGLDVEQAINRQSRVASKAMMYVEHGIYDDAGNEVAPGLVEIAEEMKKRNVDYDLWVAYRRAIRDIALQARCKPEDPGYLSPKQISEAHALIDHVKQTIGKEHVYAIDKQFDQFVDAHLELYERYGLRAQGWAKTTRENNWMYFPMHTESSPEAVLMRGINPSKNASPDAEVVRALGKGKQLVDPFVALATEIEGVVRAGEFNRAMQPVFEEISKHPVLGTLVHEVDPYVQYTEGADPVVTVYKEGIKQTYVVDPALWGSIRGAMPQQLNAFSKFATGLATLYRKGTTQKNPWFAVIFNPMIDLSSAVISHGMNPFRWLQGWATAAKGMSDPLYREWIQSLGRFDFEGVRDYVEQQWLYDPERMSTIQKIGDQALREQGITVMNIPAAAWKSAGHGLNRASSIFEEATRLGFYKQMRDRYIKKGMAPEEARRSAACIHGGISEDTLARWIRRYADFADLIARAEADWECHLVSVITKAGTPHSVVAKRVKTDKDGTSTETIETTEMDWRAAAWLLERRRPDEWGKHDLVDEGAAAAVCQAIVGIVNDIRERTRAVGGSTEPETAEQAKPGVS